MNAQRRTLSLATVTRRAPQTGAAVCLLPYSKSSTRAQHDIDSLRELALRIARLKGLPFGGIMDPTRDEPAVRRRDPLYVVAPDTLLSDEARALGITRRTDLFGGVVAHRVHATKAIVHPVWPDCTVLPAGWREGLPQRVAGVALPGYSAFCKRDVRSAALAMLAAGPVRLKRCDGVGGLGQAVVCTTAELDGVLDRLLADAVEQEGVVCERDLARPVTLSVGQADIGACRISYCGVQRQTTDNRGALVYGGSDLLVVRGEFEDLLRLALPAAMRLAVRQARYFDTAVGEWLPELIVSRNNYDVIQGRDHEGRIRSAVLEQSWRPGGASAAEVAALEHFASRDDVGVLRVSTVERYGRCEAPLGARIHFDGEDPVRGPILKYTLVDSGEDPARYFHDRG